MMTNKVVKSYNSLPLTMRLKKQKSYYHLSNVILMEGHA